MERDLKAAFEAQSKRQPEYEPIAVEDIGTVHIKRLTLGERDAFEKAADGNIGQRVMTLIHGCFDERGVRIFDDSDVEMVKQLDPSVIDPVVMAFLRFNRYTKEEQDKLLKNLTGQAATS